MKRLFKYILLLAVVCVFCQPVDAMAYSGRYGDFGYNANETDGTASIYSYSGSDTDVVVPDNINGYTVTRIGDWAFKNKNMETVELPYTVKEIGECAFTNCKNLKAITLPEGLTTLGKEMFHNCDSLKTVKLPSSVATIPENAFRMCTGLEKITRPDTVTSIEKSAFAMCSNLTSVELSKNVKTIAGNAFAYCENLEGVIIPYGVTEIEQSAFSGCKKFKSVRLPKTVKKIGSGVFSGCTDLASIVFEGDTYIDDWRFAEYITATIYCVPFSSVHKKYEGYTVKFGTPEKPQKVDISKYAADTEISGTRDMTYTGNAIRFNNSWGPGFSISVKGYTLYGSSDFSYVYKNNTNAGTATIVITGKGNYTGTLTKTFKILPLTLNQESDNVSVSGISNKAYTGKVQTQRSVAVTRDGKRLVKDRDFSVRYEKNIKPGTAAVVISGKGNYSGTIRKTFRISVLKGKTYTVGRFRYKVTDPAVNGKGTVTVVGTTYKKTDSKFTSLTVPESVAIGGVKFKVSAVGAKAFSGFKKLKKVRLGDGVVNVGANAFSACPALVSVELGKNTKVIGSKAFYKCSKLSGVTISSKKVVRIGKNAFSGIKKTAVIKLPRAKYKSYVRIIKKSMVAKTLRYKKI